MPTEDALEIMEEMEAALSDPARQKGERGAEDPTGMRLSQKSNIVIGGARVAGRTQAWRNDDGREAWLNTGELPYHLAKRLPNGQRVFTLKKPPIAEREPLDIQCGICIRMSGSSRKFFERTQYLDHMEILHPREYAREQREEELTQRNRELADRRDELAIMRTMAERGAPNAETAVEAKTVIESEAFICADCGKRFSRKVALIGHHRTHRKSA